MSKSLPTYITHEESGVGFFYEYNTVKKTFLDGTEKISHKTHSNLKGLPKNNKKNGTSTIEDLERYNQINIIRRRQSIVDLAYQNGCVDTWEYFITLTFNKELVDSYSHQEVTKYLSKWLNNQKHQNRCMKYIMVPELHKSGRIHFHGLFSHVPKWRLVQAINPHTKKPIIKNGSEIYNLDNYTLGFTTVSKVKSMECASNYLSKYITKELLSLKHKRNVWHSKNLIKPNYTYHDSSIDELYSYLEDKEITFDKETDYGEYKKRFICTKNKEDNCA